MMNHYLFILSLCFSILSFAQSSEYIPNRISAEYVEIGNIQQYIEIKGENVNSPILLFLHGGPGRTFRPIADNFTQELQKHFLVVQWDQRETGKTLEKNRSNRELNHEIMQEDTKEVIEYLLNKYNRKKLYLISHSWGSVLGFDFAKKHPTKLHAYIAISPVIDQDENTKLTISMLKDWAKKNNNEKALNELDSVRIPIQSKRDLFYQQKWLFIHNGVERATQPPFRKEYYDWMDLWFPTVIGTFRPNLFELVKEIKCPIVFIEGNADGLASHLLVEKFYHHLKAEDKSFHWFDQSGHTVFNTEPEKLQSTIISIGEKHTSLK